jgi:hypothetical protein
MKKKIFLAVIILTIISVNFYVNKTSNLDTTLEMMNTQALASGEGNENRACAHVPIDCCDWGDYEQDGIWY